MSKSKITDAIQEKVNDTVEKAAVDLGVKVAKAKAGLQSEIAALEAEVARLDEFSSKMIEAVESGKVVRASDITEMTRDGGQQRTIADLIARYV